MPIYLGLLLSLCLHHECFWIAGGWSCLSSSTEANLPSCSQEFASFLKKRGVSVPTVFCSGQPKNKWHPKGLIRMRRVSKKADKDKKQNKKISSGQCFSSKNILHWQWSRKQCNRIRIRGGGGGIRLPYILKLKIKYNKGKINTSITN